MTQVITRTASVWMTTEHVALDLGVKPDTVHKWRQRNQGPPYYQFEGKVLYDRDEVQDWKKRQRRA